MNLRRLVVAVVAVLAATLTSHAVPAEKLNGEIKAGVKISVGVSGTGGGFKKFAAGETDINNASRPIRPQEDQACKQNGIDYEAFQVAWDGLTVVIHPENTWAKKMTVEQLKKIWHPQTAARKWSDVDPSWPNEEIKLYSPGTDSGTFDYFTEAINGKEKVQRTDANFSEDDNVLVKGVAGNKFALGYFGLAYYEKNKDKVVAVAIQNSKNEFIEPSFDTVRKKQYQPLSRPLFIYVKKASLKRPEMQAFLTFYLRRSDLVQSTGYVKLDTLQQNAETRKLNAALQAAQK
jgi:phosphate transport system substrate-binding protein